MIYFCQIMFCQWFKLPNISKPLWMITYSHICCGGQHQYDHKALPHRHASILPINRAVHSHVTNNSLPRGITVGHVEHVSRLFTLLKQGFIQKYLFAVVVRSGWEMPPCKGAWGGHAHRNHTMKKIAVTNTFLTKYVRIIF